MKKQFLTAGLAALMIVLMSCGTAFAGEWKKTGERWWFQEDDGSWPAARWREVAEKWYYFDADGYMLENQMTPDGYFVGADGAWVPGPAEQSSLPTALQEANKSELVHLVEDLWAGISVEGQVTKFKFRPEYATEDQVDEILYFLATDRPFADDRENREFWQWRFSREDCTAILAEGAGIGTAAAEAAFRKRHEDYLKYGADEINEDEVIISQGDWGDVAPRTFVREITPLEDGTYAVEGTVSMVGYMYEQNYSIRAIFRKNDGSRYGGVTLVSMETL